MSKFSKYDVLICGILSPIAAFLLYVVVYGTLTRYSTDLNQDWLFRISAATAAMTLPFLVTLMLGIKKIREQALTISGKIGLALAFLSLFLAWQPVSDAVTRSKQVKNMAMRDVSAPTFDAVDILGKTQRLADHKGEVVLVNRWATWCEPCRKEMPNLDRLFQSRKSQGFTVFGMSDENADVQRKFVGEVPVTYPLLTVGGNIPSFYRDIARYPAIFLIDRQGRLQPAPGPDEPFEKVESAVDTLLHSRS